MSDSPHPETLGALWASIPSPALLLHADGTILDTNPAAENFLNLSARNLAQCKVYDRLFINADIATATLRSTQNQSPVFINDIELTTGERAPVKISVQLAPLFASGNLVLMLILPCDQSERLGRSGQAKTAAKSAIGMAEMLAHEIKNPLAGISGAAQLLSMGLQGEDRELTDLIVEEARRIVKLLEHVERFGDLRPPLRVPVNVHDALDRARKSALVGFAKHMHIIEEYDPSLPPTFADNDQLMQVFLNLIKNAAEAAGAKGGTIRLHTYFDISWRFRRRDGSGNPLPLQIEIIDDGPGLPEHIANDVFEPFVSGRENGTGLGLALVSKIVHEHDGWITVESIPGRTVFRVALPLAPREGAAHPPSVALAAHSGLTIKDL
ncbi:MAG: PAS domain-containing sensor histidine kinase [Rhodobacteraceae bacterium]|nr:PAS domain-containing sensor histidine kinase [Paracoccaceae bacterium]